MRLFPFWVGLAMAVLLPAASIYAQGEQTISDVEVDDRGDVTRIVLRGPQSPVYTAFMRGNPPRLVVELPGVGVEGVSSPIEGKGALVQAVEVGAFGDADLDVALARVSVTLAADAEYELRPGDGELVIELRSEERVGRAAGSESFEKDPPAAAASDAADALGEPVPDQDLVAVSPELRGRAAEDAPPAALADGSAPSRPVTVPRGRPQSVVSAVAQRPRTGGQESGATGAARASGPRVTRLVPEPSELRIRAGARLERHEMFALRNPDRLVIDLPGARSGLAERTIELGDGPVAQVRVGEHRDKLRVVLDLREALPDARYESTADGGRIVFGQGLPATPAAGAEDGAGSSDVVFSGDAGEDPADSEVPAAREPETEWSRAAGAGDSVVESAYFESNDAFDRVVVDLDRRVRAELVEPDPDTLIVRLIGARIARDRERRVDTKEFGGPVQIFSIFQTPDVPEPEVRVVLKRRPSSPGAIRWSEDRLSVELARGPGLSAAAQPPLPGASGAGVPAAPLQSGTSPRLSGAGGGAGAANADGGIAGLQSDPDGDGLTVLDPFAFAGPADPAAIDILEEGGFSPDKEYSGRRISLDFKDADMGNILRLIAEVSDLNVIAGEEVSGKVTIRLVDVPWDQALDVILLTKGLGFERKGNVLRIAPLEALKLEKEARLKEARAREELEDLQVKLQPVNYADIKKVRALVDKLSSPRGTVNLDERTSTLIIKDIPSVIQEATALIKAIDTATPQVMIEAKIVEANLTFSRSLGTVWGLGYRALGSRGGAQDLRFADDLDPPNTPATGDPLSILGGALTNSFVSANPASGAGNGLFNLGLLSLDDHLNLDLQLQAAEENDKGKVISSPRVVTLDNTEATIKQGVSVAFKDIDDDGSGLFTLTTKFIDALLELTVTPHITADRSIIMKIKVSRNAPQLSAQDGDVTGIAKNETETEALVNDGETVVLGGIYVVDTGQQATKVPFLADIPLLGAAFRSHTTADERRELLIFVTPRVVMTGPADAGL